ncbi:HlyD family secretion protein [Ancylobacter pratisalsi]|uniref:HlyD family efflux transporter periplasmic adaptor subunit n=1 Tax=Ancylobacter pratisalsi TaxID=1745854 RepID=A0A6P1YLD5_9HYPH|nr:HlyD family efflux transporter periplasmic adaptor subunit [Ancylobacter pratisalsi]QIB33501.1 HlyD family efflux transporter periplasmic adaptor subunit [Ancylobacter pratisalsi]
MTKPFRKLALGLIAVAVIGAAYYGWRYYEGGGLPEGIAGGNGRIEATEIDVSTKTAGRIKEILVDEGDFVTAGQVLARMDTVQLAAQLRQAQAQQQRAVIGIDTARSLVAQREAERNAATAVIAQREAELDAAEKRLARSAQLVQSNSVSQQTMDDDKASEQSAKAAVEAAKAQLAAAEAAISSARASIVDAEAAVDAAKAAIESIQADIDDSTLTSPRDGRVQYRVAQPGEVLSAGGRVLNLVDLEDVYMTFFLPTVDAGRVAIGTQARLVLDAVPQYVIPASVSFVADVAQFTPKTVETETERLKLMFRIKARIPPELLRRHIKQVKTGLPGMAYVRLDPAVDWPANLTENLVK